MAIARSLTRRNTTLHFAAGAKLALRHRDTQEAELTMLVLSRKAGQKIHIGDEIVVEIRRIAGNRITIALEAPKDMRILRGELHQAAHEFTLDLDEQFDQGPTLEQRYGSTEVEYDLAGAGPGARAEVA
jgi:carbon storage regulator CsrA